MVENITVMTWNVHGEVGASAEKIQRQKDFFEEHHENTDLFLLQAVNYEKQGDVWGGQLGEFIQYFHGERGYHYRHTGDWAHELYHSDVQPFHNISAPFNRCSLTVSEWPIDRKPLDLRNRGNGKPIGLNYFYTNFLTGPFVSDVHLPNEETTDTEGLEVWNTSIINGSYWKEEKINALETVYARIYLQNKKTNKKVVLGGDFNAPLKELNKQDSTEGEVEIIPHSGKIVNTQTDHSTETHTDTKALTTGLRNSPSRSAGRTQRATFSIQNSATGTWRMPTGLPTKARGKAARRITLTSSTETRPTND